MKDLSQSLTNSYGFLADFSARIFRENFLLIVLIGSYTLSLLWIARIFHIKQDVSIGFYFSSLWEMLQIFLLFYFSIQTLRVMIFVRPQHLTRYLWDDFRSRYLTIERLSVIIPILLLLPVFFSAFTSYKTILPLIHPFSWDPQLARWDQLLHGGIPPWKWLQPICGYPLITAFINFWYNLWIFIVFGALFWQAFSLRNPKLRMQFLLTYVLSWMVLGTLLAIVFSSAGPCFFTRVTGLQGDFRPLMTYLRHANESYPVWALDVQQKLWEFYSNKSLGFGSGISSMPSMHVSMAFLCALLGWRTRRLAGILLSLFAFIIVIGSIHLGWHYAIDDYVSILGTWILWLVAGRLVNLSHPTDKNHVSGRQANSNPKGAGSYS